MNQGLRLKLIQCINLLEPEFRNLNFTIDPYENSERIEYERKSKPELKEEEYEQILNGQNTVGGLLFGSKKQIKLFIFNYKELDTNPNEILGLVGTLYHEIRHAWQHENNKFQDEEEINSIDGNLEMYFGGEAEKDAYKFQLIEMQKHANEILEIFGVNARVHNYTLKPEIMKFIDL